MEFIGVGSAAGKKKEKTKMRTKDKLELTMTSKEQMKNVTALLLCHIRVEEKHNLYK
jgi:hypothetical protein